MRFVLFGASGYLGRELAKYLSSAGHSTALVSRSGGSAVWDGRTLGDWAGLLEGADAVVNLTGRSVNCRYNEANKAAIFASRLDSTRVIGEAVAACGSPPKAWLNSSTATIYRDSRDRPMDEATGEIGKGFSVEVAKAWEKAFFDAPVPATKRVALRSSMVMGPGSGGPFEAYRKLVSQGMGGPMAGGGMMVSWIHVLDFCRAVEWLADGRLEGTVNVCSPKPLSNREFMGEIVRATGARAALPVPKPLVEFGAWLWRTEAELPLKSRWVVPTRLLEAGFEFRFPDWPTAVRDIVSKNRRDG